MVIEFGRMVPLEGLLEKKRKKFGCLLRRRCRIYKFCLLRENEVDIVFSTNNIFKNKFPEVLL